MNQKACPHSVSTQAASSFSRLIHLQKRREHLSRGLTHYQKLVKNLILCSSDASVSRRGSLEQHFRRRGSSRQLRSTVLASVLNCRSINTIPSLHAQIHAVVADYLLPVHPPVCFQACIFYTTSSCQVFRHSIGRIVMCQSPTSTPVLRRAGGLCRPQELAASDG